MHGGRYEEATWAFRRAAGRGTTDHSLLVGLGTAYAFLWQDDRATACLTWALALDPYAVDVHVLLGDLAFRTDDLSTAVAHYRHAREMDPNDVFVHDRLLTAERAVAAERNMEQARGPRVIVKFRPDHRWIAERAIRRLEHVSEPIRRSLQYDIETPLILVIHPGQDYEKDREGPSWAAGLFDGRLHVTDRLVSGAEQDADAALAHEYTHGVLHRLSEGHLPAWLDEGLALYFEGRSRPWPSPLVLEREQEMRPLHALHGTFLGLSEEDAALAYAESYDATAYLIQRHGRAALPRLVRAARRVDFARAFEHALKEPYHVFEAAWLAAERGHASHARSPR